MFNTTKLSYYKLGAAMTVGMLMSPSLAHAAAGNNFGSIAQRITTSVSDLPGLVSALAYLFGVLLAVLGILKIKDHVENPTQTPLKDGAIRLCAGGGLLALPIILEAMFETFGAASAADAGGASASQLNAVNFGTIAAP